MSKPTLEERVAELERQVADLIAAMERRSGSAGKTDWERSMEAFADEPIMPEIIEEGRKIRETDRRRSSSDWRETLGMFPPNDPVMKRIIEEG